MEAPPLHAASRSRHPARPAAHHPPTRHPQPKIAVSELGPGSFEPEVSYAGDAASSRGGLPGLSPQTSRLSLRQSFSLDADWRRPSVAFVSPRRKPMFTQTYQARR